MANLFYVYGHFKSDTKELFYVGAAKSSKRFISKLSRNNHWKNIVAKHGFYYEILFVDTNWQICLDKEKELIARYGRLDTHTGILVNMTDGGEGCFNLSKESLLKLSAKMKAVVWTDERKQKQREVMLGKKPSNETKLKMSTAHKAVDKSYLKNRQLSDEHKINISKSKKGKPIGVGKVLTAEHRAAISLSMKNRFAKNTTIA